MIYALIKDGAVVAYPYSFSHLRRDNPQISFPRAPDEEKLAEFGVVRVAETDQPEHDAITENVVEGTPVLVGDVWTQAWTVVDAGADEIALRRQEAADETQRVEIRADAFVQQFISMTPAQLVSYIDTNVTSLATAKPVITKLSLMMLLMARRMFRE